MAASDTHGVSESGNERRRLRRVMSRIPARFEAGGLRGHGHIKNMHKQGLFLRTSLLPAPGTEVRVLFQNREGRKVEVEGTVRWTTDQLGPQKEGKSGFGVKLEAPSPDYLEFFESILLQ